MALAHQSAIPIARQQDEIVRLHRPASPSAFQQGSVIKGNDEYGWSSVTYQRCQSLRFGDDAAQSDAVAEFAH